MKLQDSIQFDHFKQEFGSDEEAKIEGIFEDKDVIWKSKFMIIVPMNSLSEVNIYDNYCLSNEFLKRDSDLLERLSKCSSFKWETKFSDINAFKEWTLFFPK